MRVTKDINGVRSIEDEPIRLDGKSADAFLAAMAVVDVTPRTPSEQAYVAKCDSTYTATKLKLLGK